MVATIEAPTKRDQVVNGNPQIEEALSKIEEAVEEHGPLEQRSYEYCALGRLAQGYGMNLMNQVNVHAALSQASGVSVDHLYDLEWGFEHPELGRYEPWFLIGRYCYEELATK